MLKDMTIGQYYPTNSFIHKLDPRTKIIGVLAFIVALFVINNFLGYAIAIIYLGITIKTSKVPFKFLLKGLKTIIIILLITVALNIFFTPGKELVSLGVVTITIEGLYTAGFMALRLVLLIISSSLLTLTTSPIELTDGIEYLLAPLKKVKVPAHEIAMMMTIALRFIPILLEETNKIMNAQMARGADFDTGGLVKKAKSLIPLLVPLFISAFRRADELAMAMEARCYRGDVNRTRMKQLKYSNRDVYVFVSMLILFVLIIVLNILI